MRPYASLWVLMGSYYLYASSCSLMCSYGSLLVFMCPYVSLWIFISRYAFLWVLMGLYWSLSFLMSPYGSSSDLMFPSNQIKSFIYTRCSTPKCVTSLRGPSPRHCARATQLLSKKCCSDDEPLATLCPI